MDVATKYVYRVLEEHGGIGADGLAFVRKVGAIVTLGQPAKRPAHVLELIDPLPPAAPAVTAEEQSRADAALLEAAQQAAEEAGRRLAAAEAALAAKSAELDAAAAQLAETAQKLVDAEAALAAKGKKG